MNRSKRVSDLDYLFPIAVRYTGLVLTVVLVGFSLAGYAIQAAPGFVAAGGMILYKTVRDAAQPPPPPEAPPQNHERWSHLP